MTYAQKQCILTFFGCYDGIIDGIWGPQSAEGTRKLQQQLGLFSDGVFGTGTDTAVRNLIGSGAVKLPDVQEDQAAIIRDSWWDGIVYFSPDEFMCQCYKYTKYCNGWPHRIQELLVRICERTRVQFGQPITIISGLRCQQHNAAVNGVRNSQHMFGEAADIYVWNTNADRVLAYLQSQPDVRYAYRIDGSSNIHFDIQPVGR